MQPFLSRIILTACLVICSTGALAETQMGLGNQNCRTWIANPASGGGLGLLYQQWIFGFLSGVSFADPDHDPLKDMDVGTVMTWLNKYCQDSPPEVRLEDAAIAFIRAHHP